jgi:alpha-1,2-mannosyltransferase
VLGVALGVETTILHLLTDPMADVRAYYDAGARLNAGQPLYVQAVGTDEPSFYRYPPLLAILFRPLAMLPYEAATTIWVVVLVAATVLTARRLGLREPVLLVAGWLALPIMWALSIGQAHVLVTFLLTLGAPWAVALAANLKLFPLLVAVYWIGRREWRPILTLAAWMGLLGVVQLVLEPAGTLAYFGFLSLDQVGQVANVSPYAISPVLWGLAVAILLVVAIRLAPTRYGWAAAVALSVFATPRLLVYQLSTLVAGLGGPRPVRGSKPPDSP